MNKETLKIQFNVNANQLNWHPHASGACEYANVGPYTVWREERGGKFHYEVSRDNSVCQWRADLSQYL